jgi:hypothetical protein
MSFKGVADGLFLPLVPTFNIGFVGACLLCDTDTLWNKLSDVFFSLNAIISYICLI